jgi:hypothetical protein
MRVRERTPAVARFRPAPDRMRVGAMIPWLERWLRQEEVSLQLARSNGRAMQRREMRWQELLRLYERLCSSDGR